MLISKAEVLTRQQILLRAFERLNQAGDPWMYVLSENDPDVVVFMTDFPREMLSIYSWKDKKFWTSLSPTRICGVSFGLYKEVFYENISDISTGIDLDCLVINEENFWVPQKISKKFFDIISAVRSHIAGCEGGQPAVR